MLRLRQSCDVTCPAEHSHWPDGESESACTRPTWPTYSTPRCVGYLHGSGKKSCATRRPSAVPAWPARIEMPPGTRERGQGRKARGSGRQARYGRNSAGLGSFGTSDSGSMLSRTCAAARCGHRTAAPHRPGNGLERRGAGRIGSATHVHGVTFGPHGASLRCMLALADGFAHFGGARAEVQVEAPFEPLLDEIAVPAAAPLPPPPR